MNTPKSFIPVCTKPATLLLANAALIAASLLTAPVREAEAENRTELNRIKLNPIEAMTMFAPPVSPLKPGDKLPDFNLLDASGGMKSLYSLTGKKGFVIVFISTQCPVTNAYNGRLLKLADLAKKNGMEFIGINANANESAADVKTHAKEKGYSFTVLKDETGGTAQSFGASVTPEAYFADGNFVLLYQGRIDDNQREDKVAAKNLENAMTEFLAGKPVSVKTEAAKGVPIKRMR